MATAEQLKALIKLHFSNDSEKFTTVAMQVAAHEASQGHGNLATEIRTILEKARNEKHKIIKLIPKDIQGLVVVDNALVVRSSLVLTSELSERIDRIINEYKQRSILLQHGLAHRRKIMLVGPPGTGKTMTASMLSHELRLPLYTVQVDRLVTKFMGETASKLRQVFDLVESENGVFFFDEFDSIGAERSRDNDVGEMRRVLSSFLQFIEQSNAKSIIIVATNNAEILDKALFRRFDDVLFFDNPNDEARVKLIWKMLSSYFEIKPDLNELVMISKNLSHAEISSACVDSIKSSILKSSKNVDIEILKKSINEKQEAKTGAKLNE